ncbi:MAG TPA: right-handed parallel beta-helix repeat-containing protein, partial [Candidatus Saccharimonadales bacterium]|nr:right-handed parallel beta-helix repeat-containing protein [Candidatus Saccharimonadales bacterium]
GNSTNQTYTAGVDRKGIYLNGMGAGEGSTARPGGKLTGLQVKNWSRNTTGAIVLNASSNNEITNNTIKDNIEYGIYLTAASNNNRVNNNTLQNDQAGIGVDSNSANNTFNDNVIQDSNDWGFYLYQTNHNTFSNNTILGGYYGFYTDPNTDYNTFTGNTISGGYDAAIRLLGSYNTITGNTVSDKDGFYIQSSGTSHNTVSSNTMTNVYVGVGVYTGAAYTVITGNNITDSGGTTNNNAIQISNDSDYTSVTDNVITDSSATTDNYAIDIGTSTVDGTYLSNNTLNGGTIHDLGIGTIYGGQLTGSGDYTIQPAGGNIQLNGDTNVTGALSVTGNINTDTGYSFNGTAGKSLNCAAGEFLTDAVIQGGIVTAGACATGTGGGGSGNATLQTAYDNSATPAQILLSDAKDFLITAPDTATDPSIVFNLQCVTACGTGGRFVVQDAGSDLFSVNPDGTVVIGTGGNTITLSGSGLTFAGTARPGTKVTLVPSYPGSVFQADGSDNTGFMTTDNISGLGSGEGYKHNYYQWATDQTSQAQDYDIDMVYQLPSNFDGFVAGSFGLWTYAVAASGDVQYMIEDADGTQCYAGWQSAAPSGTGAWEQMAMASPGNGCSFSPGDLITITVKTVALGPQTDYVRVGELQFNYEAKF